MAPDYSPEALADKMTAEQRLAQFEWIEHDPLLTAICWTVGLIWCLLCWGVVAWYMDLLPNWSWL